MQVVKCEIAASLALLSFVIQYDDLYDMLKFCNENVQYLLNFVMLEIRSIQLHWRTLSRLWISSTSYIFNREKYDEEKMG